MGRKPKQPDGGKPIQDTVLFSARVEPEFSQAVNAFLMLAGGTRSDLVKRQLYSLMQGVVNSAITRGILPHEKYNEARKNHQGRGWASAYAVLAEMLAELFHVQPDYLTRRTQESQDWTDSKEATMANDGDSMKSEFPPDYVRIFGTDDEILQDDVPPHYTGVVEFSYVGVPGGREPFKRFMQFKNGKVVGEVEFDFDTPDDG